MIAIPPGSLQPIDHVILSGVAAAPALALRERTLSFKDLRDRVATLAGWLAQAVPEPGARVASWAAKGELACLMHPGGVRVDDLDHQTALDRTAELLKHDNVTIFEAALAVDNLFIRVDILRKVGRNVELIEVKAKSYSAKTDGNFRGAKGQLKVEFLPYLRDVSFHHAAVKHAIFDGAAMDKLTYAILKGAKATLNNITIL